jgi:hypothetical protein
LFFLEIEIFSHQREAKTTSRLPGAILAGGYFYVPRA